MPNRVYIKTIDIWNHCSRLMKKYASQPTQAKSRDSTLVTPLLRAARRWKLSAVVFLGLAGIVAAQAPGPVNLRGTGGTVTTSGNFIVHTFNSSDTFTPPPGVTSVDVLVVAGGGGGGRGGIAAGGGGGGGGFVAQNSVTVSGAVTVTVGSGGAGGSGGNNAVDFGDNGQNSVFGSSSAVTAAGGGGGGSGSGTDSASRAGRAGGSGGGGGGGDDNNENGVVGAATSGQGNNGGLGRGRDNNGQRAGGGGGGAGAAGGDGVNSTGGAGGAGATSANFGGTYAGGGGGANETANGGSGGGGAGADNAVGGAGTVNTGGGGGGARNANGGAGGSGIVIVRYLPATLAITVQSASPSTNSGVPLSTPFQVRVLNSSAGGVNNVSVTATLETGSGSLVNATASTNASGFATFTNLVINGVLGTYSLRFTVAGGSNNFVVSNNIQLLRACEPTGQGDCTYLITDGGIDYIVEIYSGVGTSGFTPPANVNSVEYLVVAGGGGGGAWRGGGGGAGGLRAGTLAVTPQVPLTVTVGAGGAGAPAGNNNTRGSNGSNSVFASITSTGGGGGGMGQNSSNAGAAGGSGGGRGGAATAGTETVGAGTGGQGNDGGLSYDDGSSNPRAGGGGGGAGAAGGVAAVDQGGNGGVGSSSSISGTPAIYAGGGGGSSSVGSSGTGGSGGGGGGNVAGTATAGSPNTGGGGGGGAGAVGGVAAVDQGGNGGVGSSSSISGTPAIYAGGGGGSSGVGSSGTGGSGGGGGGNVAGTATAGSPNTGGGGGGAGGGFQSTNAGGAGGSGIVMLRYELPDICLIAGQGDCTYTIDDNGIDYLVEVYSTTGTSSFTAPFGVENIEYLVVGGGGAGGTGSDRTSGGGGAGGFLAGTASAAVSVPLTVTVGAGGTNNANGINSVFDSVTALGGGAGGRGGPYVAGQTGGSGGGGQHNAASTAGAGTVGQGNAGGQGYDPGSITFAGGGGGGATGVGGSATANQNNGTAGAGGVGQLSLITGYSRYYAGGGGGAAQTDAVGYSAGAGALGGGGAGGRATVVGAQNSPGAAGQVNTGGGGGGGSSSGTAALTGGNGGSGIVVLRYTLPRFEIEHAESYALCTAAQTIQISIRDGFGSLIENYTGTVTISNTGNLGSYTINTGLGDLVPVSAGTATYEFDDADNGQLILNFTSPSTGTISFDVNDAVNDISTDPDYDLEMQIGGCAFRIFHDEDGSVCRPEEITIRVVGPGDVLVTNYQGVLNLSTVGVTGGNWSKTTTASDANGALTQGPLNTGAATYSFLSSDAGEIILRFQGTQSETVNFNIVAANVAQPAGIYDPSLEILNCLFRVTHSGSSDVCSIAQITITLVDGAGVTVTNYTGTINLSTTSGFGGWENIGQSDGVLTDPADTDGNASYQFITSDSGTITLGFRHASNTGPVNINVSDGQVLDARNASNIYDQNITIALCTFEISHSAESNACSVTEVTFRVRNSVGGLAQDYGGTLRISNNSARGDWLLTASASGNLTAPSGADTGVADYEFSAGDNGVAVLRFYSTFPATINFDTADGLIVESGAFDPNLFYTGCFPEILSGPVCTNPTDNNPSTQINISIPARNAVAELRSRIVLMATMQITNAAGTAATFNNINMNRVVQHINGNLVTEIWAILDANLPINAGSYTGSFNGIDNTTTICLLAVEGVEQLIPTATANPELGPVNSSGYSGAVVGGLHSATTVISTQSNNSFVFSAITNNYALTNNPTVNFWRPPQPSATLTGIWGGYVPPNPSDPPYREAVLQANPAGSFPDIGKTAGSAGVLSSAGVAEVIEPFQTAGVLPPTANAHVVAAFKPLVEGQPLASDYVPVVLYETYSGALNYKAIGNTLRAQPSQANLQVNPAVDCAMLNFSTGSTAPLTMPNGSSVRAAYLYWAGSGRPAQADSQVSFGPDGNEVSVVADEAFTAVNVTTVNADFFAGYAEVTSLVTGNGTYRFKDLTVQTGNPWNTNGTCTGGWALVVVYENADEHLRVINLFHGLQPFQYSAFTLVPRNFRMATFDPNLLLPNGQVSHVTVESDEQLANGNESLGIQTNPNSLMFESLFTSLNPPNGEYNSTVTRPIYWLAPSGFYEFVSEWDTPRDLPWTVPAVAPPQGVNGDGYEIDFPGVDVLEAGRSGNRIGSNWGFDVDTHYLSHTLLEDFAQAGNEAERFTTRYRAGQDLVLLLSEVISITNFPIADLEVFISQSGAAKVDGATSYQLQVKNNGNGSAIAGQATGIITVAMQLPVGMTLLNAGDVGGSGWVCSAQLSPGAFSCEYDIASTYAGGQLLSGDSLPLITVNAKVGSFAAFPLQSNSRKASVRMLHHGGSCNVTNVGLIPDPTGCDRSPQFDNVNDTQGGTIDVNSLVDKSISNNNVHSLTTTVTGITTNLRMQKTLAESLETGEPGQYLLTVTNLGPDATTVPFTITDPQPAGVDFISASGTNWTCSTITPTLSCSFGGTLALNAATVLTLNVNVVGIAGSNVTNTAQVAAGSGNFDLVPANNASTSIATIVGPPVAAQEKFLLSVSTPGNASTIGGLGPFQNNDLIIYDPSTDEAVMFFDDSVSNAGRIDDINATHLLKNGHIVLSANGPSVIGSNNVAFDRWDLVRYDPILATASVFLDGETVFTNFANVNINGAYVMDDCPANNNNQTCSVVFTTTTGGVAGSNNLAFTASDLVIFYRSGPNAGQAAVYLEGSDNNVFGATEGNGNVNVDAFYLRVDPNDPTAVLDQFVLSVDNATAVIGEGLDPAPSTGTVFGRDDVTQLDLENDTAENLFLGDVALGVFTAADAQRRIDALHLVESGYIGHFSVRQVQGGSVCEAGVIRISKHDGLTHSRDLDYFGSVRISTSSNYGTWQLQSGNGVLTNNGNGQAIYTYVSSDQGTVILRLVHDQPASVNISVSNGIANEIGSEDPEFAYDPELTLIVWGDDFASGGFSGKTPAAFLPSFAQSPESREWQGAWVERDRLDGTEGSGQGAGVGNIQVIGGRLRIKSSVAATNANLRPEILRVFDFAAVPASEDAILRLGYAHTALAPASSVILEARGSSTGSWVTLNNFTNLTTNTSSSTLTENYNLTTILAAQSQSLSATSQIRFRVASGLELTGRHFYVDYIAIQTRTDQCGFGANALDHYAISHNDFGIACVGSAITITAHNSNNDAIEAGGETISLSTSTAKGTWARVLNGSGALTPIGNQADNGLAQYAFAPGEEEVTLLFNYTVPAGSSVPVNINVLGASSNAAELEDPTLEIAESGLLFYNETAANTTIPTQIAGKPSNVLPIANLLTIQGVRSSDNDPLQCVPLFDNGQTLRIELAAECIDADECVNGETFSVTTSANNLPVTTNIALADNNAGNGASAYTPVVMDFVTQASGAPAATIVLNYSDVGRMQLHGRYNIPFGFFDDPSPDDPLTAPGYSGDFMLGSSNNFIVRPFGFAIDFPGDVGSDRADDFPANNFEIGNSFAEDSDGTAWQIAGASFDTIVTAMGWQAGDDTNQDGIPDTNADLYDNRATPNFYYDTNGQSNNYRVGLSVIANQAEGIVIGAANPASGVPGVLTSNILNFADFDDYAVSGTGLTNMSYNEVGIIDIRAQLIDTNNAPMTYFGTSEIPGRVNNVGRFYPALFSVDGAVTLLPRVELSCTPPSTFTYMGEPFGVTLQMTARNLQGAPTVNYRGVFAKLDLYAELNARAIEEVAAADNINRSSRLENISIPANLQSTWSASEGGELQISGNLAFNRADPADPDGPFDEMIIAFDPTDNDGVTLDPLTLNAEIVQGTPEFLELAREKFRYGRILIDNTYGPETEDLAITFRVEYFDGDRFLINTDDSCTVLNSNQLSLLPGTETGALEPADTGIVAAQGTTFHNGQIQSVQAASNPTDATFTAEAAGLDNAGTIDIEIDLSATGLDLPWLQFKWPHVDLNFEENPRATIEFGQFRSHDRVIYWQEIYNGPTPADD
jgi:hypothetical protein